MIDRLHGFLNHPIGVAGIRTQKRWLGTEILVAEWAIMDADGDQQEHRVIQINVERHAGGGREAGRDLAAAVAGRCGQEIGQFTNLAGRGIDRGQGDKQSFLHISVQIF